MHLSRAIIVALTAVLLLLCCTPAGCQATTGNGTGEVQYTRTLWKVQDGLPEDTVQALAEASDGALWIGTTGGLTRFDGTRFTLYNSSHLSASAVNSIFCLAPARDGSLWVGTEGDGLLHLTASGAMTYTAANGLPDGFIRAVFEDRSGVVWVGTDSGLFQVHGDHVEHVTSAGAAGPLAVRSIAEDDQGKIWAGGSRLLSLHHGQVHFYDLPGPFSSNRVKSILQTTDGTIWVGTVSGLLRLVRGRFERASLINSTVRTLKQTSDGTLWIGTVGEGLWTEKSNVFTKITGLLPSNSALVILEDESHQIWVGLQDGLMRLSETPVRLVPLTGGSDTDFETISGDSHNVVWAAASQVYRIADGIARPYRFPGLPDVHIRNLFRDRQGDLWIGTDGSGVYRISAKRTTHYSAPAELTDDFVRAFLETRDNAVWVATDHGLNRISAKGVQKFEMKDGLVYFSTRSLLEDRSGDLWIGTDQGLNHRHGDRFVEDAATRALRHEKVWSMLQDDKGTLWFGTRDHGLFRCEDGAIRQFKMDNGLLSNGVYALLEDPEHRLWMSGPNEISSITGDQLHPPAGTSSEPLEVATYSMPYGAEDAQLYGGRQPSGYVDEAGGIWLPGSRGALHVLLSYPSTPPPPKVFIESIHADGRELPLTGTIDVPSRVNRLEIQFASLSLRPMNSVRYRYRLANFDRAWIDAGRSLTASYTNLPAGQYHFEVDAYRIGNSRLFSKAEIALRKRPYFWETWWFLTLLVLLLSFLIWAMHKARVHQVKLRFQAVLEERGRLAREMHDTVIQGCTSVSAILEAIASTDNDGNSQHRNLLSYARDQVRTTIVEARDAVWNLRHEEENTLDFADSLRTIARQFSRDSGIAVRMQASGDAFEIEAPIARELLMVVREAVYNSVLHGLAQTITIAVDYKPSRLMLVVSDDGKGFLLADVPAEGHYGIRGMQERLQRLGGTLTIASTPSFGTDVSLTIDRQWLKSRSSLQRLVQ